MRVVHIADGRLYGGVETALVSLAVNRHFCPELDQEFVVCFEGRLTRELKDCGAITHSLGGVRIRDPFSIRRARKQVRALLDQKRFDVVITHMARQQALFGSIVRNRRRHLVAWQHGPFEPSDWLERLAGMVRPQLAICTSGFMETVYKAAYERVRTEVLHPAVPTPTERVSIAERERVRGTLGAGSDSTVIIQVSRLERWKGHAVHLEALAQLRSRPNWFCWFVGGVQRPDQANYLAELQQAARRLGIGDRVLFLGERSDVRQLLGAADIFCQPNIGPEPFGIVFIEAMQAGLPIVTSAMGGALEIANKACGELATPGDPRSLASSLVRFLASAEERVVAGEAGRARAFEMCQPERQLKRLSGILATL